MKIEDRRTCSICHNEFSRAIEFCPVCLLRKALADGVESREPLSEGTVTLAPERVTQRFDHYELLTDEDGHPVELGRGAMGVTYKAVDVDLQCPVTLKVISERYLDDESARQRFLREARAAASVRHPNVASVLHLGRTGSSYFYAMEFVEGATLESVIKRSGQLEGKLALEITTQVAAGLAAVHKQKLVHRDIKPSNIMVTLQEGGAISAKIIDLGLAKAVNASDSQTAISVPGGFVGTPDFASPEQFAGVQVDIRSDLYSLGATLWKMLTGRTPFRGTSAELMYLHLHAPLAIGELDHVPRPVAVLLEMLLAKDPAQRFQTPIELLMVIPSIMEAIDLGRTVSHESLRKRPFIDSHASTSRRPARRGPQKISIARLPVTGSDMFGREEDLAFLDDAWVNQSVKIVTIVAWGGVGKSTLVNHWLRRMATELYRSAELVFGWSFYRQGISGGSSTADEFLDVTLNWFGDPDPCIGTAWEKGERLAKLIAHRRTLLILDGLEPLQYPPGPQEGRVREPSLQALLRELAAFNTGLCVITTRLPVADIADHQHTSAQRRDLEHLPRDAGANLLRALGVEGDEEELRRASDEFRGHCLALTLLGSYLSDAYNGDIRCREEISARLADDVRQGFHARRVMESYQTWFGEGPELSVLRILGLFDRPADPRALGVLLKSPPIPGLTESLIGLKPTALRSTFGRLRRARLLAGEDAHNPGQLDTHPLVREYFGEQLRNQQTEAWKECNRRLYHYYRNLAPQLPENFGEMEPLLLAVICGCNADLFREVLHEVYIPRIQRGTTSFAANVLRAREALLTILAGFFENKRWGAVAETRIEKQNLTAEDRLFILMQAGLLLTTTRGLASAEARTCYEHAEPLSRFLNRPILLYVGLIGQWRYSLLTGKLSTTLDIANRVHALAKTQNHPGLMVGAYRALAATLYHLGNFEASRENATRGCALWRTGIVQSPPEEVHAPIATCLCYKAISEWHLGEIVSSHADITEAISVARELNDMPALANAINWAVVLRYCERNPVEVERLTSDLMELSMRHHFAYWLAIGTAFRGWARSVSGDSVGGLALMEEGLEHFQATGVRGGVGLALKAEALHLAHRTSEALQVIREAEMLAERQEERWGSAELHRLRGVFLASIGADEAEIETALRSAISTARKQNSISLAKRAEATYAKYNYEKARPVREHNFRLPL
jgi:serine/threonine protein kinase/tetratricopeptide (TPR) repeat protein